MECFQNKRAEYDLETLKNACNKALINNDIQPVSVWTIRRDIENLQNPPYNLCLEVKVRYDHRKVYRLAEPVDSHLFLPENGRTEPSPAEETRSNDVRQMWLNKCIRGKHEKRLLSARDQMAFAKFHSDTLTDKMARLWDELSDAIIGRHTVKVFYRPRGRETKMHIVFPYLLKEYSEHWYLLAMEHGRDEPSVFRLDGIKLMKTSHLKYRPCPFNLEVWFRDLVGVTKKKNDRVVVIVVQVLREYEKVMNDAPLHSSQKRQPNLDSGIYVSFSLQVIVNNEFINEIIGRGFGIRVLYPEFVRDMVIKKIHDESEFYSSFSKNCQE